MRCPKCDSDNREGRKFCARCGAALGWMCADCGFANSPDEDYCGGCGRGVAPSRPAAGSFPGSAAIEAAGERRQVAILFADLCGFTSLSTRLDAEDLRRLIDEFYSRTDVIIA